MAQKIVPENIIQAAKEIAARPEHADQPFFLFDVDAVLTKVNDMKAVSKKYFSDVDIAVSLKSCSLGLFTRLMAQEDLNAEVCSADEFRLAEAAGFSGDRIILDGPYKNVEDLSFALDKGALIHVDSARELHELAELAAHRDQCYGVGVRISHYYREGQRSRFGVTAEEYYHKILPLLISSPHLYLKGFHLHVGSNLESPQKITDNLNDWLPFLVKNMPKGGHLDMGSGFPADSFSSDVNAETCEPEVFLRRIFDTLVSYNPSLPEKWKLIFEPGRYLSEDNGYAVGKTLSFKQRYDAQVFQTNLGINWLPSIHNWHHSLTLLDSSDGVQRDDEQILAGFNCFENDCLYPKGRYGLREGQSFMIRGCGAYDMQTANEWTRIKPPVYALLNKRIVTARVASPALPPAYRDLLHNDENIRVDDFIRLVTPSSRFSPALYEIVNHNRKHFSEYMAWPNYVNHESDEARFLDACYLAHQKDEGKTYVVLFNDEPVGLLSFNSIDKGNKTAYIGYWLDMRVEGNGIITKSIKVLLHHYTTKNMIKRFVIKCSVDNIKSNEVAKRCGFELEGKLREAEYLNGHFHDQNIYSWIASDAPKN